MVGKGLLRRAQFEILYQRLFEVGDGIIVLMGELRAEWRRRYGTYPAGTYPLYTMAFAAIKIGRRQGVGSRSGREGQPTDPMTFGRKPCYLGDRTLNY